jgi:hypothetical protein
MSLLDIIGLLARKKFVYIDGSSSENICRLEFTTGYNGRGDSITIALTQDQPEFANLEWHLYYAGTGRERNEGNALDLTPEQAVEKIEELTK